MHACLEGPEAGVYYRGTSCILPTENFIEITLPDYVDVLMTDYTVHVIPVINDDDDDDDDDNLFIIPVLAVSAVKKGKFKVFRNNTNNTNNTNTNNGISCYFDYIVFAKRLSIEIEPKKAEVVLKGSGPYTWV